MVIISQKRCIELYNKTGNSITKTEYRIICKRLETMYLHACINDAIARIHKETGIHNNYIDNLITKGIGNHGKIKTG